MKKMRKGISLIEVILTIALVGMVIPVVFSVFSIAQTSYQYSTNRGFSQQSVRAISNFLTEELRYATNFTGDSDIAEGYVKFYSLTIDNSGEQPKLIKASHEYSVSEDSINITSEEIMTGNWTNIVISNTSPNLIDISISQSEGNGASEATYQLPLNIKLGNTGYLLTGSTVDLLNTDGTVGTIYYKKAIDNNISAKIDVVLDSGTENNDDDVNLGTISDISITKIEYSLNDGISWTTSSDGEFLIGSNNTVNVMFKIEFDYTKQDNLGLNFAWTLTDCNIIGNTPELNSEDIVTFKIAAGKDAVVQLEAIYTQNTGNNSLVKVLTRVKNL